MTICHRLVLLSVSCAFACATGVDVSDEELAAIVGESGSGGSRTPPAGPSGSGGSSVQPAGQGGSSTPPAGPNGSGGRSAPPVGGAGAPPIGGSGGASAIAPSGGCNAPAPTASGGCAADTSITVSYTDRSTSPNNNQITMALSVATEGAAFNHSDVVLRYWFNGDDQSDFVAEIDFAAVGKENVCVSFGNQLGQSFADIGFTTNEAVGEGIRDVQVRLHTPNYAALDQANDFSYLPGVDAAANENVTVYVAGTQVTGCEPD